MTHSNETTGVAFRPRFKTGTAHRVAEDQAAHGPIVVLVWHELLLNDGSDYTVSSKGAYSLQEHWLCIPGLWRWSRDFEALFFQIHAQCVRFVRAR